MDWELVVVGDVNKQNHPIVLTLFPISIGFIILLQTFISIADPFLKSTQDLNTSHLWSFSIGADDSYQLHAVSTIEISTLGVTLSSEHMWSTVRRKFPFLAWISIFFWKCNHQSRNPWVIILEITALHTEIPPPEFA